MSLGITEVLLILAIVLIFFGPSRLPSLGRSVGEAIRGFKHGLDSNASTRDVTASAPKEPLKETESKA